MTTLNMHKRTTFKRGLGLIVVIIVLAGSGLLSIWLGQDANWDLSNYHFYNAFALVEHRLSWDVQPAQLQTYFNPLLDLPFYLLVTNFSARTTAFFMGAIHGLNFILLLLISNEFLKYVFSAAHKRWIWAGMISIVGFLAPVNYAEHGATFNDNMLSIPFLAAFLLIVKAKSSLGYRRTLLIFGSALLLGAALGIKLTLAPYVLGMIALVLWMGDTWKNRLYYLGLWGGAVVIGFLSSAGWWMWALWQKFENPLFPFYNSIFNSPFGTDRVFNGRGYGALQNLFLTPFKLLFLDRTLIQWPIRDIRLALLFLLIVLFALLAIFLRKKLASQKTFYATIALASFASISYVAWFTNLYRYRYLQPLELLAPLIIFLVLTTILTYRKKLALVVFVGAAASILFFVELPQFGRIPFDGSYFGVELPPLSKDQAVVFMDGGHNSFLVPFFPPDYRFIRVRGNLLGSGNKDPQEYLDSSFVQEFITPVFEAEEKMYLIRELPINDVLAAFDFREVQDSCAPIQQRLSRNKYVLCELERIAE